MGIRESSGNPGSRSMAATQGPVRQKASPGTANATKNSLGQQHDAAQHQLLSAARARHFVRRVSAVNAHP